MTLPFTGALGFATTAQISCLGGRRALLPYNKRPADDRRPRPYLLWRVAPWFASPVLDTGGRANLNFNTAGFRWSGKLPHGFDYATEIAKQIGALGSDRIDAWAGHWRLGYTIANLKLTPRVVAEYNYATGDSNAKNGRRGTFDPLYATGHDNYGLADQVGWRNIHDVRLGSELKPGKKWLISTFFHDWWLATAQDALYAANGLAIARPSACQMDGMSAKNSTRRQHTPATKQLQLLGGYGHMVPGEFLRKATPGRAFQFSYLMAGYSF